MYKFLFWLVLILFVFMCSTEKQEAKESEQALFIRICNYNCSKCSIYFFSKDRYTINDSIDIKGLLNDNEEVFFGQKKANYSFLHYISKDTITLILE